MKLMKKRSKDHKLRVLLQIIYLPVTWLTKNQSQKILQGILMRTEEDSEPCCITGAYNGI